jgi:translation elongation factor P/translation initiation factor 5A
MGFKY